METAKDPNKNYLGIQALRAIAALMVVAHHAMSSWRDRIVERPEMDLPWTHGQAGVDIFFVISGFVMAISAESLSGHPHKALTFLRRRFIRIIPLYWIFTTFRLLRLTYGPPMAGQTVGSAWHVIASYLFLPSTAEGKNLFPLLAVGWTLNFEMMFYYLFAVALALDLAPLVFLAPTLGVIALVGCFHHPSWPALEQLASPLVLEFLFGVLLARFVRRNRLPDPAVSALLLVAGAVGIACVPVIHPAARALCWGLPALMIVAGSVGLEERIGRRLPIWLLELGNASYAIYLVHLFVVAVVWSVLLRRGQRGSIALAEMLVLSLVLSAAAGEVVHRVIELPLMNLFRGKRVRGVSVLPSQAG